MFIQGQQVVCINASFPAWVHGVYQELPKQDAVYTVRAVGMGVTHGSKMPTPQDREDEVTIWLEELSNAPTGKPPQEPGFRAERFAPLTELSEEDIEERVSHLEGGVMVPVEREAW